jgi:predicted RNA-binding Zn ribbon-like protein
MKFEFVGGNLALDLANTVHDRGALDPQDDLKTHADLIQWGRQAGLIDARPSPRLQGKQLARAEREFHRTLELRDDIYAIAVSRVRGEKIPRASLQGFNRHLRKIMADAGLRIAGKHFELVWGENGSPLSQVRAAVVRSAVTLLTSDDMRKVRECGGDKCSWLFVDSSRNGRRRWCDMRACGNRAKVRRFRQRKPADRRRRRLLHLA